MKYLLISGAPNTGKTETIYDLTHYLINIDGYNKVISGSFTTPKPPPPIPDFQCVISNGTKKILINSATDNESRIDLLLEFYKKNPDIDVIITSIRDGSDPMRNLLLNKLKINYKTDTIELPLAKITRRIDFQVALDRYKETVNKLVQDILKNPPFSL